MNQRFPLFIVALALLAGCVTADVTIKEDGSADLTVSYPAAAKMTEEAARPMLTAPGVTIKSITVTARKAEQDMGQDSGQEPATKDAAGKDAKAKKTKPKAWPKTVTATLQVTDLEKIETIPLLKLFHLAVTTTSGEGGTKTIKAVLTNPTPGKAAGPTSENVITVHVPGELGETTATTESGAAVWKFSTPDYFSKAETSMSLSYKPAKAGAS